MKIFKLLLTDKHLSKCLINKAFLRGSVAFFGGIYKKHLINFGVLA